MAAHIGRVGFLVKTWPKLSETFILEEVLGLERLGQELHIFALNAPTDAISHEAVARVRAPASCLGDTLRQGLSGVLSEHVRLIKAFPLRYVATVLRTLARPEPGRRRDFLRGARLANELLDRRIDHLHAHFVSEPAAVAEIAAGLSGCGYSLSAHAKDIYLSGASVLRRKLNGARFTVTCTEYNRRHLEGIAPNATLCRMYHGIDLARFHPSLRREDGEVPLILAVGRLREKKGFATLIDACARLREAGQPFRCEIVGYGEEQASLEARIAEAGLQRHVALAGKLPREEVIERYARAAAFVLPSQLARDGDRDGIPNVLLEAMAMEVPVVSTSVSGIPELVRHGRNGLLVEPENPTRLAAAIAELLGDAPLRNRLGRAARETVAAAFDNERNLLLLRELLESCHERNAIDVREDLAAGGAHAR